jgi:hypothetical protein
MWPVQHAGGKFLCTGTPAGCQWLTYGGHRAVPGAVVGYECADDLRLLRLVAPLTGRHCPFAHIDTWLPGLGGRFLLP